MSVSNKKESTTQIITAIPDDAPQLSIKILKWLAQEVQSNSKALLSEKNSTLLAINILLNDTSSLNNIFVSSTTLLENFEFLRSYRPSRLKFLNENDEENSSLQLLLDSQLGLTLSNMVEAINILRQNLKNINKLPTFKNRNLARYEINPNYDNEINLAIAVKRFTIEMLEVVLSCRQDTLHDKFLSVIDNYSARVEKTRKAYASLLTPEGLYEIENHIILFKALKLHYAAIVAGIAVTIGIVAFTSVTTASFPLFLIGWTPMLASGLNILMSYEKAKSPITIVGNEKLYPIIDKMQKMIAEKFSLLIESIEKFERIVLGSKQIEDERKPIVENKFQPIGITRR